MYINDTHLSERGFGHDSIIHVNTVSLSDVVIYCSTLLRPSKFYASTHPGKSPTEVLVVL